MVTVVVQEQIRGSIVEDCSAPPFAIDSFALDAPAAVEIGTVVNAPSFNASYNRPPTFAQLTNNDNAETLDVTATPTAFASAASYVRTVPGSVTWTLQANEGGPTDSANAAKAWQARIWVGWTTLPGPYTEANILALNELFTQIQGNALWQRTLAPTNGYLVGVYHDVFNGAVATDFLIGNFIPGGAAEIQTGLSMTIPGGTGSFSVARSNLMQTSAALNWQRLS